MHINLLNGCAQLDFDSVPLHQVAERMRDRAGAAHREMHAILPLEIVDQGIDAGRVEGIAPDEEWLDRKRLPELWIGEMSRHHAPHGFIISQLY